MSGVGRDAFVTGRTTEILLNLLEVLFTGCFYASSVFASLSHRADIGGSVEQLGSTFEESTDWIHMIVMIKIVTNRKQVSILALHLPILVPSLEAYRWVVA